VETAAGAGGGLLGGLRSWCGGILGGRVNGEERDDVEGLGLWTAHARAQVTAFGTIKFVQVNLIGFFRRKATLCVDLRDMSPPDWNIDWILTRLDWGGCEWRCRFH